jgi:hypothetical protein
MRLQIRPVSPANMAADELKEEVRRHAFESELAHFVKGELCQKRGRRVVMDPLLRLAPDRSSTGVQASTASDPTQRFAARGLAYWCRCATCAM